MRPASALDVEHDGTNVRIRVAGDIDLGIHQLLADACADAARTAGVEHIEVDLSGVVFCDSGGLGVLIAARRTAHTLGVTLTVSGATGLVHKVLDVTGVLTTLADGQ
ncbi:STAS domain-containing protein [Longispora sp. K20-0274]|uniref:STAS domain-containing protein n=1 Tax=Longispora sp. K20-0274 TaxID=3088255 RepID=UPI00399A86E1